MRTNRLKNLDTVYILGAGSSYACSLPATNTPSDKTTPLDLSFNSRILSLEPNAKKPWVKDIIELVKNNWIGDIKDYENIGLEESIIQRLGNYELLKSIHPVKLNGNKKSSRKCNNAEYINNLSHIIVELLSRCRQNTKKQATAFARHVYSGKHKELGLSKKKINRIITFNYDTLLDDALLDVANISPKHLYFDRIKLDQNESDNRKAKDVFPHPYLLKLHGSINWRISSNTYAQIINGEKLEHSKPPIWLERKNTPDPNDDISPLIMPPLPYKPITTTPIFSHLWKCAFEYLHEARRIVIAGYSCPQTDSFAMSMLSQLTNTNVKEIVIIDPDSISLNKYRNIMNKKMSKKVAWSYYSDFIDYIEHQSS